MIEVNESLVGVGDAFSKKGDPSSRYTVNRIEKTTDAGIEQITSIRLRQIFPVVLETQEEREKNPYRNSNNQGVKTVFVDCSLGDLLNQYSLVHRRGRSDVAAIGEIITAREEKKRMLHRIDNAVKLLRESERHDDWNSRRMGPESLHLDVAHLSDALGEIVVFKSHRWLAWLIYMLDKAGKNYSASMSSNGFELEEGYGFVTVSTKNKVKKGLIGVFAGLLERLNGKNIFTKSEFVDYENAAWEEDDSYSIKDLVENKHRDGGYELRQQQAKDAVDEMLKNLGVTLPLHEESRTKVDVDKLPSKEEILEQTKLMKQYEDEVVRKAAEEKIGTQTVPTLEHIITPQGE